MAGRAAAAPGISCSSPTRPPTRPRRSSLSLNGGVGTGGLDIISWLAACSHPCLFRDQGRMSREKESKWGNRQKWARGVVEHRGVLLGEVGVVVAKEREKQKRLVVGQTGKKRKNRNNERRARCCEWHDLEQDKTTKIYVISPVKVISEQQEMEYFSQATLLLGLVVRMEGLVAAAAFLGKLKCYLCTESTRESY